VPRTKISAAAEIVEKDAFECRSAISHPYPLRRLRGNSVAKLLKRLNLKVASVPDQHLNYSFTFYVLSTVLMNLCDF
jgi:cytochrome oxidase assembly protein ShyY1